MLRKQYVRCGILGFRAERLKSISRFKRPSTVLDQTIDELVTIPSHTSRLNRQRTANIFLQSLYGLRMHSRQYFYLMFTQPIRLRWPSRLTLFLISRFLRGILILISPLIFLLLLSQIKKKHKICRKFQNNFHISCRR